MDATAIDLDSPQGQALTEHQRQVIRDRQQHSLTYQTRQVIHGVTEETMALVTTLRTPSTNVSPTSEAAGERSSWWPSAAWLPTVATSSHEYSNIEGDGLWAKHKKGFLYITMMALALTGFVTMMVSLGKDKPIGHVILPNDPTAHVQARGVAGGHPSGFVDRGCKAPKSVAPGRRVLQLHNRCAESIWPAVLGQGGSTIPPPDGGWMIESGDCKTVEIDAHFPSMRVWARTGCDSDYKCVTGGCITNGDGGCTSSGETPVSLWEGTLQDHCGMAGGLGPDFYDNSLVDGYNLPIKVYVQGGTDVPGLQRDFNCQSPLIAPFDLSKCPFELRVYSDQVPGTNIPVESINGKSIETSPCFATPLDKSCVAKLTGCRSICKAIDQGWVGYFIDNAKGPRDYVDPVLTMPDGSKIRFSEQYLQGDTECGMTGCKMNPAWGPYRKTAYGIGGRTIKNLVCCDGGFACSPYQHNDSPGCSYFMACPTLGAGDPDSKYHGKVKDTEWPQANQDVRLSSNWPDWPLASNGHNYARLYKDSSPQAYSWQFNDLSSTFQCCGVPGKGPHYTVEFCPV